VIGARLTQYVKEALKIADIPCFLWRDSTSALAWIKRNDELVTFVENRVKEICSLTRSDDWRHIPGIYIQLIFRRWDVPLSGYLSPDGGMARIG